VNRWLAEEEAARRRGFERAASSHELACYERALEALGQAVASVMAGARRASHCACLVDYSRALAQHRAMCAALLAANASSCRSSAALPPRLSLPVPLTPSLDTIPASPLSPPPHPSPLPGCMSAGGDAAPPNTAAPLVRRSRVSLSAPTSPRVSPLATPEGLAAL